MATLKLTKKTVDGLKAPDAAVSKPCSGTLNSAGLGVGLGSERHKSWIVQAKLKTGQTRRITLTPTNVISLEKAARGGETQACRNVSGITQSGEKAAGRAAVTVRAVLRITSPRHA